MDIINVVSVTSPATVRQWYEENDDEVQQALYWRQAFDVRTYELSVCVPLSFIRSGFGCVLTPDSQTVELVCSCNTPANPDHLLVGCTTEACKTWMHENCIKEDAMKSAYERLGRDKPHVSPESKGSKEDAKRPLSPTETGAAVSAHSIDVKSEGGPDAVHVGMKDNVEVKPSDDEDAPTAPEDAIPEPSAEPPTKSETDTPNKLNKATKAKPGRPRKKGLETNGESAKPWLGLFEVNLKMQEGGPNLLEFKDLREGIVGGDKTWAEPMKCLVCRNELN